MLATGCTYGKGNIHKLFWGKWALTLVDKRTSRAIRASMRPEAMERALEGPFLKQRLAGVLPSNVPQDIAQEQFDGIVAASDEGLFTIGEPFKFQWSPPPTTFQVMRCESCGELTVLRHMRVSDEGKRVCVGCARSAFDYPTDLALTRGPEHHQWPFPPNSH